MEQVGANGRELRLLRLAALSKRYREVLRGLRSLGGGDRTGSLGRQDSKLWSLNESEAPTPHKPLREVRQQLSTSLAADRADVEPSPEPRRPRTKAGSIGLQKMRARPILFARYPVH